MAEERKQSQIKLSRETDDAIEHVRRQLGMTKVELLSRVCQWFTEQPELVQRLVTGTVPRDLMGHAREILIDRLAPAEKPRKTA